MVFERVCLLQALLVLGEQGIDQSLGVPIEVLARLAPSPVIQDRIESRGVGGRLTRNLPFAVVTSAASARVLPHAPRAVVFLPVARDLPDIFIIWGVKWAVPGRARGRPRACSSHRDHRWRLGSFTSQLGVLIRVRVDPSCSEGPCAPPPACVGAIICII